MSTLRMHSRKRTLTPAQEAWWCPHADSHTIPGLCSSTESGYYCTLQEGHPGRHIGGYNYQGERVYMTDWPNSETWEGIDCGADAGV